MNFTLAILSHHPYIHHGRSGFFNSPYVPSSTQKAVWKAIGEVDRRLEALGDRIDQDALDPDEFSDAVKSFMILTQRTSRDEKLRAAANLLTNLMLRDNDPEKLTFTEADHFWRCLDSLSIGSIQLLGLICREPRTRNVRKSPGGEQRFSAGDVVPLMKDLPPHVVLSLVAELGARHLLRTEAAPVSLETNGYRENDPVFLTPSGLRFVETVLQAGATEG